jgi:MerR family transcriptional regulator, redox-sensitive transcriptional activator SoxR
VDADQGLLSIGEVALDSGLRTSALRYYEEEGLIHPDARLGGRRHYHSSVLSRLALIALLQEVGFTVAEIRDLLGQGRTAGMPWKGLAEAKLADIDAHIEKAQATRRLLQTVMECGCEDPANCDLVERAGQRRLAAPDMAAPNKSFGSNQGG